MLELGKAIYAKYAGAGGATLRGKTPGDMWPDQAPQNTSPLYIVYSFISSSTDWTFDSNIDLFRVQFSIWDDDPSPNDVLDAGEDLKALYDDALLTVSGYYTVRADRVSERLLKDVDKGWVAVYEYVYFLQTT